MSTDFQNKHPLGKIGASGELPQTRGQEGRFPDRDYSVSGVKPLTSGMSIHTVWVDNVGSTTLLPSEICLWDTAADNVGIAVDNKCGADGFGAGVVDPFVVSTGVVQNNECWIVRSGPCDVIHAGNDTISAASLLITAAAGRVDLYTASDTAAEDANALFGLAIENPADSAGVKFRAKVNFLY